MFSKLTGQFVFPDGRKPAFRRILTGLLVLLGGFANDPAMAEPPRNLILMIGDGMGPAQIKAYRMYADSPATEEIDTLPIDGMLVGSIATDTIRIECAEDGDAGECVRDPYGISESAATATAYSTGRDTLASRVALDPGGQPMRTLLEEARDRGKATGLVVTSEITHATPAAFAAHVANREWMAQIADQMAGSGNTDPIVNVMLGGGLKYLLRTDRNLLDTFKSKGYEVVYRRVDLLETQGSNLLGLFADEGLPRAWDRNDDVPSLADMTSVALDRLGRNPKGFFLLVEGSQIDWAGHINSTPGIISEMEDFMAAVQVVLDYARVRTDTLVLVTADHETGGMSLGRDDIYRWNPRPIRGMTATPKGMAQQYLASDEKLSEIVAREAPFELNKTEIAELDLAEREEESARKSVADIFNYRTLTGWSSLGHTSVDVPLYAMGAGSERFHGFMQNEEFGQRMWQVFLPRQD